MIILCYFMDPSLVKKNVSVAILDFVARVYMYIYKHAHTYVHLVFFFLIFHTFFCSFELAWLFCLEFFYLGSLGSAFGFYDKIYVLINFVIF